MLYVCVYICFYLRGVVQFESNKKSWHETSFFSFVFRNSVAKHREFCFCWLKKVFDMFAHLSWYVRLNWVCCLMLPFHFHHLWIDRFVFFWSYCWFIFCTTLSEIVRSGKNHNTLATSISSSCDQEEKQHQQQKTTQSIRSIGRDKNIVEMRKWLNKDNAKPFDASNQIEIETK